MILDFLNDLDTAGKRGAAAAAFRATANGAKGSRALQELIKATRLAMLVCEHIFCRLCSSGP